jgi:methyl-accepting chemotaxis protein
MTIGKKITVGFALPMAILVVISSVSYWSIVKLIDTSTMVTHTQAVRTELGQLQVKLLTVESTGRGYMITGDETYLEPFHAAFAGAGNEVDKIQTLTSDNSNQQGRVELLRPLVTLRLNLIQERVEARRTKGLEVAAEQTAMGKGKTAMESIKKLLDEMEEEEITLQQKRDQAARDSATLAKRVASFGAVLAAALVAAIGFLVARSIIVPVREAVGRITSTSAEILAGTTQQAASAQEQAAAVAQTVVTVDEVTQTAEQSAERAKAVAESAKRSVEVAKAGRKGVENNIAAMATVRQQVESIAENMLALADRAQAIGEIIATVSEIADRTNLLALNAAIEASRAGEQGKGFAVVAVEVKALAEQSKKATTQVRQILGEIQRATNTAVMSTEQGSKAVNMATQVIGEADETIRILADTVAESARSATQIVASAGQQATGVAQISLAMKNIDQATQQTLAATQQAEQAAKDLNALGVRLQELMERDGAVSTASRRSGYDEQRRVTTHG